jgi:hypothetical protein
MSSWTIGWVLWALMFAALEGAALLRNRDNRDQRRTLTAHIRQWFSLQGKSWGWRLRRGAFASLTGWLVYHFWLQG